MKLDILEPGVVYHFFNRGNNREDLFKEDKNYHYFLSLMEKYLLPISEIYAYCLMRNHFHIVVRINDADALEPKYQQKPFLPFSNMFNAYVKAMNKMYNRTGSLFETHPRRIRVDTDNYLLQLVAYIHLNPSKHGFTDDYKNYKYSSYKAYFDNKSTKISTDYVMSLFGDKDNFEYWHDLKKLRLDDVENK